MAPAATPPLGRNEKALWRAVLRVSISLLRALNDDLLATTGLSLAEHETLAALDADHSGGMRVVDLAAATGLSHSRMSRLVDQLRAQDLLTKRRAQDDARGNLIEITAKGSALLAEAEPQYLAAVRHRFLDHLEPELTPKLASAYAKVIENLDADRGLTNSAPS
jgi:DNA-binding MarR family transcriptional regulator